MRIPQDESIPNSLLQKCQDQNNTNYPCLWDAGLLLASVYGSGTTGAASVQLLAWNHMGSQVFSALLCNNGTAGRSQRRGRGPITCRRLWAVPVPATRRVNVGSTNLLHKHMILAYCSRVNHLFTHSYALGTLAVKQDTARQSPKQNVYSITTVSVPYCCTNGL